MKKFIILPLLSIFLLSGCSIIKNGSDLSGFIFRMNGKNESYTLTENGFLYDSEKSEFYKYFILDEHELLLSFKSDEKARLTEMNITIGCFLNESDFLLPFVTDAIIKAKNGNTELLLDVTEIGTVITVYKDL